MAESDGGSEKWWKVEGVVEGVLENEGVDREMMEGRGKGGEGWRGEGGRDGGGGVEWSDGGKGRGGEDVV